MAFGKFSELNELTALRSSGINPLSIIKPVLIVSIFLSLFLSWFSNSVLPEANNKAKSLFIDIRLKKPGFELQPNVFYNGIDGYTFLVKEIDNSTDSLYNITLFQNPTNTRNRAFIKAKKGFLSSEGTQGLTLMLENGEMLRHIGAVRGAVGANTERTIFSRYRISFDLSELQFSKSDPERRNRSDRTMSAQAMGVVVDTLQYEIQDYYTKASEMNSFKSLASYNEDPESVGRSVFQNLNKDSTSIASKVTSNFLVINQLQSNAHKNRVLNLAHSRLEDHRSKFENSTSNMLWRFKRVNKFLVEIHKKFSIPFACVVFILLGAPIGIMTKKGNFGYAAIISAVILTIYWVSIIQGEKLADRLFITPFWGMWSFNIFFSIIGISLIIRLSTEISISNFLRKSE